MLPCDADRSPYFCANSIAGSLSSVGSGRKANIRELKTCKATAAPCERACVNSIPDLAGYTTHETYVLPVQPAKDSFHSLTRNLFQSCRSAIWSNLIARHKSRVSFYGLTVRHVSDEQGLPFLARSYSAPDSSVELRNVLAYEYAQDAQVGHSLAHLQTNLPNCVHARKLLGTGAEHGDLMIESIIVSLYIEVKTGSHGMLRLTNETELRIVL